MKTLYISLEMSNLIFIFGYFIFKGGAAVQRVGPGPALQWVLGSSPVWGALRRTGDQRYIPINGTKTWKDAQTYCRENHTDLVSVRNQTENDLIHNMTKSGTWVWIGLYRDYWQWSDQRNSSFRYWKLGTPDNGDGNQCAVAWMTATDKGRWDDQKCNGKYPFICYGDARK
uniref:C-type lectin domain-containing protein n=1 Tax=Scleropages formosus TaxID=113540 RepID=A0A8C9W1P8_SCLFO